MTDVLSPPGSSTYDSNTMFVGDGTWDSTKNDFLLPNLVGLNFETMQYNGMGNRFAGLTEYHVLIKGHGIVAAITFLLFIPAAIFIARFYYRDGRLALRLHIYLQIINLFLITVVIILGFMAVGPDRALTNPHHGIGLALYVLVLVQFIGGAVIHRIEKGKQRWKLPLKLILHQWMGRAIALLGIAQIALGLTLYGSPKVLFILYALAVFAWVLIYFILTHVYSPFLAVEYSEDGSYLTGPSRTELSGPARTEMTEDRRSRQDGHGFRNAMLGGAGLTGLAAWRRRSRQRREEEEGRRMDDRREGDGTRMDERDDRSRLEQTNRPPGLNPSQAHSHRSSHQSGSYIDDEKYDQRPQERHTWRDRILGAGAGLATYEGAKRFFSRRRGREDEDYVGNYSAPLGGNQNISRTDISRVQAGQAPFSPGNVRPRMDSRVDTAQTESPTRQGLRPRPSSESLDSYDSRDSHHDDTPMRPNQGGRGGGGIGGKLAALSGLTYIREKQRQRRERKEERRQDDMRMHEQENTDRITQVNSQRNRGRFGEDQSIMSESVLTGAGNDNRMSGGIGTSSRQDDLNTNAPPLPASAAALPPGSNRVSMSDPFQNRSRPGTAPGQPAYPTAPGAVNMPSGAMQPDPSRLLHDNNSRPHAVGDVAAGALVGAAGANMLNDRRRDREDSRTRRDSTTVSSSPISLASPPVSVKVKVQSDGRHVTLRRLNEEEAAAEHAVRRAERRRRRASSLGSGAEDQGSRFRRDQNIRPSANDMPITNVPPPPPPPAGRPDELNLPPMPAVPPVVPAHSSPHGAQVSPSQVNASGLTSGGYDTGTGTEMSAFDDNRRRRRAERAAKLQRAAGTGARVDFA